MYEKITSLDMPVWQPYTCAWTANAGSPSLGNGTLIARYLQVGKTVHFTVLLTYGSTSTGGTGGNFWRFSIPVTAANIALNGGAYTEDSGVAAYVTTARLEDSTHVIADWVTETSHGLVGSTTPFTWATGDYIRLAGTYESV